MTAGETTLDLLDFATNGEEKDITAAGIGVIQILAKVTNNMVDPSGKFGVTEFSVANNIRSGLAMGQSEMGLNIFSAVESGDSPSLNSKAIGVGILVGTAPKLFNLFSRKLKVNFKCKRSFVKDTLVYTENGLKPIQEIIIGEKIWSWNIEQQEYSLEEVTHIIESVAKKKFIDLVLENQESITSTATHPFYVINDGWIEANKP